MTEVLDEVYAMLIDACLFDDMPRAQACYRKSLELMAEHKADMQEQIAALRKRKRLRREGR